MSALSIFQRLPQHIAEAIARLYVRGKGIPYIINGCDKETNAWLLLYGISHSWRSLALAYFCGEIHVKVLPKTGNVFFSYVRLPRQHIERDCASFNRYPKSATIILYNPFEGVPERQRQSYMEGWHEGFVFPSARSLTISIRGDLDPAAATESGHTIQTDLFDWVEQRVKASLPQLQEAHIEHISNLAISECELELARHQPPNRLFLALFDTVKKLGLDVSPVCLIPNDVYFANSSGLTSLDYICQNDGIDFFSFIVQKSVSTLQELKIRKFPMDSIKQLVLSNNNTPIVYSRLEVLVFQRGINYARMRRARIDKSVAVFPVLRYLKWEGPYAFEDNTPLRGNNETLEYLNLGVDPEFAILIRNGILFPKLDYPKLHSVTTDATYRGANEPVPAYLLVKFIANFVSSETLLYRSTLPNSFTDIVGIISTFSYARNITVLALEGSMLSLLQVIEVIRLLPNMTDLSGYFEGLDPQLQGRRSIDIICNLCKRYYPLSKRFKRWRVDRGVDIPIRSFATSAMAIAILCPKFIRLSTPHESAMELARGVKAAIEGGGYKHYVERLTRIFL
ncbi:hypothetical protein GGI23_002738 [Coemansia sp. RSA 2559]|nr:hypothetical protein GGI23_002738 [Coemansia sp. RSA 2559]